MKVKMLHPDAKLPKRVHSNDAGLDLVATSKEWDEVNQVVKFGTGIAKLQE